MKVRLLPLTVFFACTSATVFATEPRAEPAKKSRMRPAIAARIAEEAKKQAANPAPAQTEAAQPASKPDETSKSPLAPQPAAPSGPNAAASRDNAKKAARAESATTANTKDDPVKLPAVEVTKSRITELDRQLAKQEKAIERERKNITPTETDMALNDLKIAKPLAILGGESTQFRQHVASERVELMEAEKDLIEAIAYAKRKEEKQELQKQLDELKAMRRQLEKSLR